ncbi:amidohydrolase family protein [Pseudomonas sp. PLB05]|uniref:amidohydrolase family protein n=1 Tax=Pseudomonas sp. PLB05 TaxID=2899078 RepID=UPI001E604252|nr:amidohydrolase family protein [Pseudomonas sp. PLB05]MCD4865227.1 amidohydrolase family protein [Pseudomonas sp. PLB05]
MIGSREAVIDTHVHVFHRGLKFIDSRRFTPDYDVFYERLIEILNKHGVDKAVLIAISILGADNSYLLESLKRGNGRLRGVVAINPAMDIDRLPEYADSGAVGIRLNLTGNLPVPDFKSDQWPDILEFCRQNRWHIEVNDRCDRLPMTVEPLLESGTRVVVDHFGMPNADEGVSGEAFQRLLKLADTQLLWLKLSGAYRTSRSFADAAVPLLVENFGAHRLVWASDWPFTQREDSQTYQMQIDDRDRWLSAPSVRRQVLWDTPSELFHFNV